MSKMDELQKYVLEHAVRGACCCGRCVDALENPQNNQPTGHTADMVFFKVAAAPEADAARLRELVEGSVEGSFCNVNILDGQEHSYLEVGGWIGDQGVALTLMGLGAVLGLWKLLTPMTMLGLKPDDPMTQQMAGMGMISIQA